MNLTHLQWNLPKFKLEVQFSGRGEAETEYMKACAHDDGQDKWEKEEILNACTDILTVTVKEVLEDEEDFIQ